MLLATRFKQVNSLRKTEPLSDDEIRYVAPSIFATAAHSSRSQRYAYIPTSEVLAGLRKEGFQPFMVCQSKTRDEGKQAHTKHMLRLRHASQITGDEANEIILINSHDGTTSYQMLAGMFRFVCHNGLVRGNTTADIRVRHQGPVIDQVIQGAFDVLDEFTRVEDEREAMKAVQLADVEQTAFARAALALRYEPQDKAPPITENQLLHARRFEDSAGDLWSVFNRVQENTIKGGLSGRSAAGRSMSTRPVKGIDQNVKLNRALWSLADEMRRLKAGA